MSLSPIDRSQQPEIRWMKSSDRKQVLKFEKFALGKLAWKDSDYVAVLKHRNVIGTVYETQNKLRGCMVYELHKTGLQLLRLVVHPDYQRTGIGTEMAQRLKDKLTQQRRQWIEVDVPEIMLPAQLFFQSCGFVFTEFVRSGSDVEYRMRYEI